MVWPIKAILPLSLARFALAHTVLPSLKSPLPFIEDLACLFEFAFYIHYRIKRHLLITNPPKSSTYIYPEIDKQPPLPPLETLARQLAQFEAALPEGNAAQRSIMKQEELSGWFTFGHGSARRTAKYSEIHRQHVSRWMAWLFWDTELLHNPSLQATLQPLIDPLIDELEKWVEKDFQSGDDVADVKPIILNLDPLRAQHRPILHYVVTHLAAWTIGWIIFKWRGFERKVLNGQEYYIRKCREKDRNKCEKPLCFISGIGIGLISYESFIAALTKDNRDIILFDLPEISLRWTPYLQHTHNTPLQTAEIVQEIVRGCTKGEKGAHAVAHSFGCVVIQWLLRLNTGPTPIASSVTMVDPVCFLLISPSVAQHFCYRPPSNFLDELVDYFVAREIGVNNALHRHFQWKINDLDPQLLPVESAVILSELDSYVPSLHVERLLKKERPDVAVKVLANYFHSEFQLTKEGFSTAAAMSKLVDITKKSYANLQALDGIRKKSFNNLRSL
ncbi:hypothetical protein TrRE_jg11190 [Triparma retinervis]|uniref:AB hydrolase-1 domain-containing protein n=1 Tax=Triparma retinervis TaxID=2557542 RepID=A0A9W6ZVE5_9STRA|nr:hypothetical protein TrRE_jg11190 [Triparma retinervis]